jgi:hypothetical protein
MTSPDWHCAQSRREDRLPPILHARASDRPPPPFPRVSVLVGPERPPVYRICFARSLASPSEGILCCGGLYCAMGVCSAVERVVLILRL